VEREGLLLSVTVCCEGVGGQYGDIVGGGCDLWRERDCY
jgi:hypothetical protein